jgi:hypothetical protein
VPGWSSDLTQFFIENTALTSFPLVTLGSTLWPGKCDRVLGGQL